jgi:hyperosmotically inducible periplasmic protein
MAQRSGLLILHAATVITLSAALYGCDKPSTTTAGIPPPSMTVGTVIDDSVITASVKSALLADADIKSFDFKVETRKGEVLLSGFVDNQAQLDRATSVTRSVSGVKSILNNVSLKGLPPTVGNKVDAGIITAKVKTALLADEKIKSLDIAVITRTDEVQLSGFVDNQTQIDRAMEIARGVDGVRTVSNQMSLKK